MTNRNPKLISQVLHAVLDLHECNGSTARRILDHVCTNYCKSPIVIPKPRNVVMHVRRALKHSVESGRLIYRGGKYLVAKAVKAPQQEPPMRQRCGKCGKKKKAKKKAKGKKKKGKCGRRRSLSRKDNENDKMSMKLRSSRKSRPAKQSPQSNIEKSGKENCKSDNPVKDDPDSQSDRGSEERAAAPKRKVSRDMDKTRPTSNNKRLKRSNRTRPVVGSRQATPHPRGRRSHRQRNNIANDTDEVENGDGNDDGQEAPTTGVPRPHSVLRSPARDVRDGAGVNKNGSSANVRQSQPKDPDRSYLN